MFNQPYTPVIYTALVSAPNITTTGDTPVDANRNTVVVSSKEINSGNGIYTWQVADAGYYKITLWGAQGGNVVTRAGPTELRIAYGGRGAKTEGIIWLRAGLKLTFYLGGQGRGSYLHHGTDYIAAGFNGGGKGGIGIQSVFPDGAGGGGATDVRIGGKRIMVAAGGGGGAQEADRWYPITPGPGGKETSNDTPTGEGRRAQGIAGVKPLIDGDIKLIKDGTGQSGAKKKSNATIWEGNSGAGGGYYGGYAGQSNNDKVSAATGGTSYISGYNYTDGYESLYKPEYYIFNKDSAKMFSDGDADYATTEGLGNGKFEVILLKKDTDVTAED
ncbi:MAG: hypothetical protein LBB22_00720 [Treponema sp.]|nr:hypothetical protein [Treponema sp.]